MQAKGNPNPPQPSACSTGTGLEYLRRYFVQGRPSGRAVLQLEVHTRRSRRLTRGLWYSYTSSWVQGSHWRYARVTWARRRGTLMYMRSCPCPIRRRTISSGAPLVCKIIQNRPIPRLTPGCGEGVRRASTVPAPSAPRGTCPTFCGNPTCDPHSATPLSPSLSRQWLCQGPTCPGAKKRGKERKIKRKKKKVRHEHTGSAVHAIEVTRIDKLGGIR